MQLFQRTFERGIGCCRGHGRDSAIWLEQVKRAPVGHLGNGNRGDSPLRRFEIQGAAQIAARFCQERQLSQPGLRFCPFGLLAHAPRALGVEPLALRNVRYDHHVAVEPILDRAERRRPYGHVEQIAAAVAKP